MTKLGQNFLTSKSIAKKIAEVAEIKKNEVVLEIGPGRGILTEELLKTGASIIAVEKDAGLFGFLKNKFEGFALSGHLTLINDDIRDFLKIPTNVKHPMFDKVVANIPYYLTGQLLRMIFESKNIPDLTVLMLQKEVAKRITDKNKNSLLGLSVRVFSDPKIALIVSAGNFNPRPKVDSAVVVFKKREKDFFREHKINRDVFFKIVRTGFGHPRKLLKNNLKMSDIECLTKCNVDAKARAENLTLENWACFAKKS